MTPCETNIATPHIMGIKIRHYTLYYISHCKNLPSLEVSVFIATKVIGDIGNTYSPWMTSFDSGMPRYLETIIFTCGQWGDKSSLYAIVDYVIIH